MSQVVRVTTVRRDGTLVVHPQTREIRVHSSGVEVVTVKGALYPFERVSPTEVKVDLNKPYVEAISPSKIAFAKSKAEAEALVPNKPKRRGKPTVVTPKISVAKLAKLVADLPPDDIAKIFEAIAKKV